MNKNGDLEIMNLIVGAIEQSDEWEAALSADAHIQSIDREFSAALDAVDESLTFEQSSRISSANCGCAAAYSTAGILYGMRVAFALMETLRNPQELSKYVLDKLEGGNT